MNWWFNLGNKFVVSIIIVISIVLQSLFAVAAPTESHQVDIEHIQSEHDHADDLRLNQTSDSINEHDTADCHHCDHCSGSHFSWMLVKTLSNYSASPVPNLIPYQNVLPQEIFETSFKPPIA